MCGIAGLIAWRGAGARTAAALESLATAMTNTIAHRGPDDSGVWCEAEQGIALGHRRLAIVDLSPLGHQPMASPSGRFVIVFNGEFFNYRELQTELRAQGCEFTGLGDTATFLVACEHWGVARALERVAGQFAFALWDRRERCLTLARDRLGEKPLFVADTGAGLAFASELRAFAPLPNANFALDRASVAELLRFGYIASDATIYASVVRLPPGTFAQWCAANGEEPRIVGAEWRGWTLQRYWTPATAQASPFVGDRDAAIAALDGVLRRVVSEELDADVPVGTFLSGGVDSTAVVALAQAVLPRPVRTFSIGFHEPNYDEAPFARAIAKHLGTDHTEVYVGARDALAVVRELGRLFDEPFADPSQIPAFMVARIAREHVTVCLSGDGGDEVFGGYNRYFSESRLAQLAGSVPRFVRSPAASVFDWLATGGAGSAGDALARALIRQDGDGPVQDLRGRFAKLANLLRNDGTAARYWSLISLWQNTSEVLIDAPLRSSLFAELDTALAGAPPEQAFMQWDLRRYLPGDNLTKVDRTSMAVSLEIRAPLLDHRVYECATPILRALGVRGAAGETKWPLRALMDRYVPPALTRRPKMGFSVPVRDWLRGDLRSWAEELLSAQAIAASEMFQPTVVARVLAEHLSGTRDHARLLWPVLMFQQWFFARG